LLTGFMSGLILLYIVTVFKPVE